MTNAARARRKALLIVDVQPTFCEGGELAVAGGNAVAERIAGFVSEHRVDYDVVATTQDWHIDPGDHFSPTPDFVDTWPAHGLADTPNAQLHPALTQIPIDVAVKKGQHEAAYSGFEGALPDGTSLDAALRARGVTAVDVVGIAESHCVKETALDAQHLGYQTRVLTDLTVPVTPELGVQAREAIAAAGVELATTAD